MWFLAYLSGAERGSVGEPLDLDIVVSSEIRKKKDWRGRFGKKGFYTLFILSSYILFFVLKGKKALRAYK